MNAKLLVVGSMNMDLIVSADRFPASGETVIGTGFSTAPGGKGANQAIQAARLGAAVTMVGKVGNDSFGRELVDSARASGVDTRHIGVTDRAPTGVSNIQLQKEPDGSTANTIVAVPGANLMITPEDVAFLADTIGEYDMVILQHEISFEINRTVAGYAKAAGVPVMLNPAPSAPISADMLALLTYISPNEHEALDITGVTPQGDTGVADAVAALHKMGVANVLITLGGNGCAFSDGSRVLRSECVSSGPVIDPTAAGDSFIGAFCTAVAAGLPTADALRFANCTAGITVSRMGAQTSLPTLDEVLQVMRGRGFDTAGLA